MPSPVDTSNRGKQPNNRKAARASRMVIPTPVSWLVRSHADHGHDRRMCAGAAALWCRAPQASQAPSQHLAPSCFRNQLRFNLSKRAGDVLATHILSKIAPGTRRGLGPHTNSSMGASKAIVYRVRGGVVADVHQCQWGLRASMWTAKQLSPATASSWLCSAECLPVQACTRASREHVAGGVHTRGCSGKAASHNSNCTHLGAPQEKVRTGTVQQESRMTTWRWQPLGCQPNEQPPPRKERRSTLWHDETH